MAEINLRYCVGAPEGVCFPYEPVRRHPEFRQQHGWTTAKLKRIALQAALIRAKRGEAVLHCSTLTGSRRRGRRELCYVEQHKQPTNLTLVLAGVGTIVLVTNMRKNQPRARPSSAKQTSGDTP